MKDLSTGTTAVVESVEHVEESLQRLGELFA
jgi:hypothetical protein